MTVTPQLSRRLGKAVGTHSVTPDERTSIIEAFEADGVTNFDDLPQDVRDLVEAIEDRPIL